MATILAAKNGNWSDTATWTGGVLPGVDDIVMANGKAITIDQNIAVGDLGCSTFGGAISGGYFLVPSAISITCSASLNTRNNATSWDVGMIRCSHAIGTTIDVYANISASENPEDTQLFRPTNATVGGITIHGSVLIPSGQTTTGAKIVIHAVNSTFTTITITGNVESGARTWMDYQPIMSASTSAVLDFHGTLTAKPGLRYAVKAGGCTNRVRDMVCASDGTVALYAPGLLMPSGTLCSWTIMDSQAPFVPGQAVVMSNFVSDSPPPSDVRAGKTYGPSGTLTGTCAVPDPDTVAVSVPVDATVGTAMLRPADVAAVTGAQIAAAVTA